MPESSSIPQCVGSSIFLRGGGESCAYVYPQTVDDNPGRFFDAWANDQDWALDNYLIVRQGLFKPEKRL